MIHDLDAIFIQFYNYIYIKNSYGLEVGYAYFILYEMYAFQAEKEFDTSYPIQYLSFFLLIFFLIVSIYLKFVKME